MYSSNWQGPLDTDQERSIVLPSVANSGKKSKFKKKKKNTVTKAPSSIQIGSRL